MLQLMLRGLPVIYYGDELGLAHVDIPPSQVQDPRELREPGLGLGRDPERTPMPWDTTPNAGFTTGTPWLPLGSDWSERNVAWLTTSFPDAGTCARATIPETQKVRTKTRAVDTDVRDRDE